MHNTPAIPSSPVLPTPSPTAMPNSAALRKAIGRYYEDKRSGIVSDPNNLDDEEYIVRLVRQVVTVSVETVRLVDDLAQAVTMDDWMRGEDDAG